MKRFHYFILFIFCSTASFSQKIDFEIHAGLVGSILKPEEDLFEGGKLVRRYSGTASLLVGFPLSEFVRVRTGLGYSSRGGQLNSSGFFPFYGEEKYPIKINYIELPCLLSVGPESINLLFGPQISFITKSDIKGLNNSEFGVKYGLGIDAGAFVIRLLFYNGLSNMPTTSEVKMKNSYFSVALGWKLIQAKSVPKAKDKGKYIIPHRVID